MHVPLLVGGAALSEKFTRTKIAPGYGAAACYAKDAMTGLRLMNEIMDPATRDASAGRAHYSSEARADEPRPPKPPPRPVETRAVRKVRTDIPIPAAPYLDRRVRDVPNLAEVWSYINPYMLYGRHLGFKGNFEKLLAERDAKALEAVPRRGRGESRSRALHEGAARSGSSSKPSATATPSTCSRPARATPLHTFHFGRQPREDGLCLSDYILDADEGRRDHLALFVVTAGAGIRERTEEAKASRRIFQSARLPGAGHRNRRRLRRMAAPPHPRGLGLPRPAHHDHAGALHLALPRQALQLRLSRLPQPGRPAGHLETAAVPKKSASN